MNAPDKSAQYEATNTRRFQNFTFFWQAAALGLAAQAFLFSIALGDSTADAGRYVACILSIAASVASLALMHTQRGYQEIEGNWMDIMEKELGWTPMGHAAGREARRDTVDQARHAAGMTPLRSPTTLERTLDRTLIRDATRCWCILWWVFVMAAVAVIIVTGSAELFQAHNILSNRTHS